MALPSSGEITFAQLNMQLKRSETAAISLNDAQVRALAKKTSGAIAMTDLHGKWAGTRLTVGASGGKYGYKAGQWGSMGALEGGFDNKTMESVAWGDPLGEGANKIWLVTAPGNAQPGSRTIKITDDSFNVIGTYSLNAWADAGNGAWYTSTPGAVANPFSTTSGTRRWFTW